MFVILSKYYWNRVRRLIFVTDMTGVAKETFKILLGFDYVVKLYDADGMTVAEPAEARRFFAASPNILVSLNDADDDSSIKLWFGKSTHANDIDGLMQALRSAVTKYNMTFEPQQYGKEIDPKDYQNLMSVSEAQRKNAMKLCEGMYGTTRASYLLLERVKLIVHHTARIDPTRRDGRMQQIGDIVLENAKGERMRFPSTDLGAARALAMHVNKGGSFSDKPARAILERATPKEPEITASTLAENNEVVVDFLRWADKFQPIRALVEYNDPSSSSEEDHEEAGNFARSDFRIQDFLNSDELEDIASGRGSHQVDPEDRTISKQEIMDALNAYILNYIQSYSPQFQDREYMEKTDPIAQMLYDQVAQAMETEGWTIDGGEMLDDSRGMGEADDDRILRREDVLLPNRDKAASLGREALKTTVHDDPTHPNAEHDPGASYTARLQTLAGLGRRSV
jgi:hypothetical protein